MAAENILITGASSPIGAFFCKCLTQDFPNATLYAAYNKNAPAFNLPRLKPLQIDFSNLSAEMLALPALKTIDTVIHLASVTPGNNMSGSLDNYYAGNVYGVMALFQHMAGSGNLKDIFYLSSSAVYNRTKGSVLNEMSEKTHLDPYGLSKLVFEHEMATLHSQTKINMLGLRVPVLLVDGVKYNFISKWKLAIEQKARLKIANPDAAFNAVCPGWALFEAFKGFTGKGSTACLTTNIFASESSNLRAILKAADYDLWDEVPATAPAQTLTSIYKPLSFPPYNALKVVKDFLLEAREKGQAA